MRKSFILPVDLAASSRKKQLSPYATQCHAERLQSFDVAWLLLSMRRMCFEQRAKTNTHITPKNETSILVVVVVNLPSRWLQDTCSAALCYPALSKIDQELL